MEESKYRGFAETLLDWFDGHARSFPWRGEVDPYRIWVSEAMLQQTRTETVREYYPRFLAVFPTVEALARADETDVLKQWEGLGYYTRARNLHAAAKRIVAEFGGQLPRDSQTLATLPGIGPYMAAAVASIAFNEVAPALDGNQLRVLSRVLNIRRVLKTPMELREEACALMSPTRPGDYNQALFGLGAGLCARAKPNCEFCPVRAYCQAYALGDPETLPMRPPKKEKRMERRGLAVVVVDGRVLIRKRGDGLLKGLWEFPHFIDAVSAEDVCDRLNEWGILARPVSQLGEVTHVFSHLVWVLQGWHLEADTALALDAHTWAWVDAEALSACPMSAAMRSYRRAALEIGLR